MAGYQSGSATSFADLQAAILTFLQTQGWTLTNTVLNKGTGFFQFTNTASKLVLNTGTGQSGTALTGVPASQVCMLSADNPVGFPVTYEFHYFNSPDEFICVIQHNGVFYQQLALGQSLSANIGGTGWWMEGSYDNGYLSTNKGYSSDSSGANASGSWQYQGFQFFAMGQYGPRGMWLNYGVDGTNAWGAEANLNSGWVNWMMMQASPNQLNQGTILVPIRVMASRPSSLYTEVLTVSNIRMCRNDAFDPGAIYTLGTDKWKIYPFYSKNTAQRNGVAWGTGAFHSGTYAYAVRYQGP